MTFFVRISRFLPFSGVLNMILLLFNSYPTRQLAVAALTAMCQHGSFKVRHAVANKSNYIARFIWNSLDDYKLSYYGITTITLCMKSILEENARAGTEGMALFRVLQDTIDVVPILETIVEAVKRHHSQPTRVLIDHAIDLLSIVCIFAPDEFNAYLPAVRFLVAGLRSRDWDTRGKCLHGCMMLHTKHAQYSPDMMDPMVLIEVFKRGLPDEFKELYDLFEPLERSRELISAFNATSKYSRAIHEFMKTPDYCTLGTKQVECILTSEYAVTEGRIGSSPNGSSSPSIPADRWIHENFLRSLPLCAQALRKRNSPGDDDMADILDIEYLFVSNSLTQSFDDAIRLAENALKRSPRHAYFHYAVSRSSNHDRGLRAAKEGLECPNLTLSLNWLLFERVVYHAGTAGASIFVQTPVSGGTKWKEGIALLKYAYATAKKFVATGPPDSRLMKAVGYWLVLLTIVMEDDLSRDLRELDVRFLLL